MSDLRAIAHDSAFKHAAGSAIYVDDMDQYREQLHVAVGCSTIARGKVVSIDLSAVHKCAGVVDVLTVDDIPGTIDIGPVFPGDPLLSLNIEFHGQAIFAVAARSQREARKAVMAAQIDYETLDPLTDLQQAIDECDYVRPPHSMHKGDAQFSLQRSPHKISGYINIGGQDHFYLEGQVSLAVPTEDGGVTVYSSNQNPTETQKIVAEVLALAMQQVTVITRRMGGGFGGKETQAAAPASLAACFAVRNQCAVSCRLSRRDDMIMTGKRHPFLNRYQAGFDESGNILSINYQLAAQCGFSPDLSDAIVDRAMFHCDNCYYLPNVSIEGLRCRSNTASNTAFRGFGGPQGMLAMETVIDEIAYALNMDPLDVRCRNFYGVTERNVTPYHQTVKNFNIPAIVSQLEAQSGYRDRRRAIDEFNRSNRILKRGIALTPVKFGISFTVNHLNQAGALLHLYADGSFHLNHGGTEMGQGLMIKVAQIVAREFSIDATLIKVSATRTDKVPNTSATAASAGTDLNGMAAQDAAKTIKSRLIEHLGEVHAVSAEEIKFEGGKIICADRSFTFAEVATSAYLARIQLSAAGFYRTPDIHYDRDTASGQPFYYYATGAAVSEVVVDTLTGEYKLNRVDIVHDAGDSINPAVDIGQIEGGFIQGTGWLTSEELKWDHNGRLLTDGPATYKIPAISDCPREFNVALLQNSVNEVPTVLRSKAVGEPPLMLAISVHCAIRDAIGALDGRKNFPSLMAPATPEEVLRAIGRLQNPSASFA